MSQLHPTIQRLEALLSQMKWRKSQFCEEIEISSQLYNSWRTRGIPAARIKKIARHLGVSQDWLEDGVGLPHIIQEPAAAYNTSADEQRLIALFKRLRIDQRTVILELLDVMGERSFVPAPPMMDVNEKGSSKPPLVDEKQVNHR